MEMFDEPVSTKIEDGKVTVETEVLSPDPKEVENAVADFVHSYRQFRETNSRPDAATDANLGMAWWKRLEYLGLADSRLKNVFCGPDRSPRSIAQYHRYRLKLVEGKGHAVRISGKDFREDFQRYITIQTAIMGAVHLTHPTCANCREDFVRA